MKLHNAIVSELSFAGLDYKSGGLAFLTRNEDKCLRYLICDTECFKVHEVEFPFIFQANTSQRFESQEYIFEK